MKAEQILTIMENPVKSSWTVKELQKELSRLGEDASTSAIRKMLYRLEQKGLVEGEFDHDEKTDGYPKFYTLTELNEWDGTDVTEEDVDDFLVEVFRQVAENEPSDCLSSFDKGFLDKHLPEYNLEGQTKGSGALSGARKIVKLMLEYGYVLKSKRQL